jgi:hypothetical protein
MRAEWLEPARSHFRIHVADGFHVHGLWCGCGRRSVLHLAVQRTHSRVPGIAVVVARSLFTGPVESPFAAGSGAAVCTGTLA